MMIKGPDRPIIETASSQLLRQTLCEEVSACSQGNAASQPEPFTMGLVDFLKNASLAVQYVVGTVAVRSHVPHFLSENKVVQCD